jgi:hypothetical protein
VEGAGEPRWGKQQNNVVRFASQHTTLRRLVLSVYPPSLSHSLYPGVSRLIAHSSLSLSRLSPPSRSLALALVSFDWCCSR